MAGPDEIVSTRGDLVLRRGAAAPVNGIARMWERLSSPKDVRRVVVTGEWCLYAHLEVLSGELEIGGETLATGEHLAMFVPPHGMLAIRLRRADVQSVGFGARLPREVPADGRAWLRRLRRAGRHAPQLADALATVRHGVAVDPDAAVTGVARRVRRLLPSVRSSRSPVRDLARRLGYSEATLSREFKARYGLTIKDYVHRSRVSDAVFYLLAGGPILDIAAAAGFEDVSNFYRQFRRITANTPKQYRAHRRPSGNARKSRAPRGSM